MKSYEETIESVYKRSNAIIKKRAERRKTMRRITSVLSCFIFVVLFGVCTLNNGFNRVPLGTPNIGILQDQFTESNDTLPQGSDSEIQSGEDTQGSSGNEPPVSPDDRNIDRGILQNQPAKSNDTPPQGSDSEIQSSEDTQGSSDSEPPVSPDDCNIVWAEKLSGDMGLGDWNGKQIGVDLFDALSHYSDDTVFAILVQTAVGNNQEYSQFVYNGKTLDEYEKAAEEESNLPDKLALLLNCGDDLKYGEALYKVGNGNGQKWTKEHYDNEVAYFGEELLSKYIVNGEFLREKLEFDCSQPVTVTSRIAWYEAYDAYESYIIRQTKEQFVKQGIEFENKNAVYYYSVVKYPLGGDLTSEDDYIAIERTKPYLIIYISKEAFSSLTGNYELNVFYLADKNSRDGILPFGTPVDLDLPSDAVQ